MKSIIVGLLGSVLWRYEGVLFAQTKLDVLACNHNTPRKVTPKLPGSLPTLMSCAGSGVAIKCSCSSFS